jgi:O-antigen/teichoic acid export membrane protein
MPHKPGIDFRMSLVILSLVLLVAVPLAGCAPSAAARSNGPVVKVYYVSPDRGVGPGTPGGAATALKLAEADGFIQQVSNPAQAEVFVLNGAAGSDPATVASRLQAGSGLVLIPGPDLTAAQASQVLGVPVTLTPHTDPVSLVNAPQTSDPLTTEISWNSSPQVRERTELKGLALTPIIVGYENQETILGAATVGKGQALLFSPTLGAANQQIQDWSYFNYLVYHLTLRAAGHTPLSFGDYPSSPVPHDADRNILLALMALLVATSFGVFFLVRRYSKSHPEALDQIVADQSKFERREEGTQWEEVGFHRPLSGFLVAISLGLVMFIPLIIYQNLILPVYILPSAQALGIWGRVTQFFNVAWLFFDMGTSIAFIKYLSQYRVHDPRKGIQFGQLFVWWQALSGAVQVALVIAISSSVLPHTAYAFYAWSIIIHTFIQLPGFYQVMRHTLNGLQRQDYSRYLDISLNVLMPMLVQPVFVTIMYAWGKANPVFGGTLGGLLGLGIAAYTAELFTFLIGLWLYRRIGYSAKVLFLAHFDWDIVKTGFKFGVFEMLGSVAWSIGQAAEIGITQIRLINYAEIWGNWGLAQNFIFAFNVIQTLFDGTMPAISEAISNERRLLSQYYSAQAYKWGGMISAFLCAVLLAVADRFILGASGPDFGRAATYVVPLTVWGAIQYFSWVGDTVQLGANKPYLKSVLILLEQTTRIVLAWFLLERFQIYGLIVAYFIGLLAKGFTAYFVNNRICFPQRFYFWQSLGAPILAGAVHFGLLRWLTGYIWQGDQLTSVLIFFIAILPSFPIYLFLYGLFGGWDKDTLDELENAVSLTGFVRPLAWVIWRSTSLGARISPLTGRFPISIRAEAMAEAASLTGEKIKLS